MTKASTLTASSTGKTLDARPHAPRPSAWPALRQSVVKQAPSTTNIRDGASHLLHRHGLAYGLKRPGHAGFVSCLSHMLQRFDKGEIKVTEAQRQNPHPSARDVNGR